MAEEIAWGADPPAGRFRTLLKIRDGAVWKWIDTDRATDISYSLDEATGIGTVTIRAEGGAEAPRPDSGDGEAGVARFAITESLSLAPGSADVLAEIASLDNTGASPIQVDYLFMRPFAVEKAPRAAPPTAVPNLWNGPVEGWWRLSDGSRFGIVSRDGGVVSAKLWMRSEDGSQHPDVRCADGPAFTLRAGDTFVPRVPFGALVRFLPE